MCSTVPTFDPSFCRGQLELPELFGSRRNGRTILGHMQKARVPFLGFETLSRSEIIRLNWSQVGSITSKTRRWRR